MPGFKAIISGAINYNMYSQSVVSTWVKKELVPGLIITIMIIILVIVVDILPGDGGERVRHPPGVPLTGAGHFPAGLLHQGLPGTLTRPGVVVREEAGQVVAGQGAGHHSV